MLVQAPSLRRLRSDLARLRRRRALVRLGTAFATAALIVVCGLAGAFAIDYLFDLSPFQRAFALLAIAFLCGWTASLHVARWLGQQESETDVALVVERQHSLHSGIVAALQFQSDEAATWGSRQLEQAVIEQIDESTREFDPLEGFSWKPLPLRLLWLALLLLAVAAPAFVFPHYATAFVQRLALADVSYPTRTQIASLTINGDEVDLASRTPLRVAAGSELTFVATVQGQQPTGGSVLLEGVSGGRTTFPLESNPAGTYRGLLDRLAEPVDFSVRLGDGQTPPRRIELVSRPSLSLELKPTPPEYARANAPPLPPAGVRTTSVLEGSSVGLVVRAGNKALQKVHVEFGSDDQAGSSQNVVAAMTPSADRRTWSLDPAGTPLADVARSISVGVVAVDDDGLSPAEPVTGTIRLRADRPPRVAAAAVVRRLLPDGKPELTYGATDDFGVRSMRACLVVTRGDGTRHEARVPLPVQQDSATEAGGRHALEFAALGLKKGDRVVVTIEAEDSRGDRQGATSAAQPLVFEITDREGLLAGLLEADEEGAERLDAIIRRELGIGGQP